MYRIRYNSLRKRLVLPFGLLALVVGTLLSSLTLWIVADIEDYAIERVVKAEMERTRHQMAENPATPPLSSKLIRGTFLPSDEFPSLQAPEGGEDELSIVWLAGQEYSVLVGTVSDRPYALLYERSLTGAGRTDLAWVLAAATLLLGALSALVGHLLAGQVVRPIRRLLTDISEKVAEVDLALAPVIFSRPDYPPNEIGELVRAMDRFALRLHGFAKRESYFSADVSHELRTPIAIIRGAAEVLVEAGDFPDAVRQRLRTIHRQAVRAGELLEAMLLLAREGGRNPDPACAVAEVIEEAMADCASSLGGQGVALLVDARERPILPVERPFAYVVFSNLLRNACAHTRKGSITVRLFGDRAEILDTGIGIAEDRFPAVFDRHVKGEESSGSGLGLSIVARITQTLGWQIAIESRPGEGTQVTVRFGVGST